jgi:hypothetical protein
MSHYTASNFWLIASAKPLHIVEDTISWSTEEEVVPYDGNKIKIRIGTFLLSMPDAWGFFFSQSSSSRLYFLLTGPTLNSFFRYVSCTLRIRLFT